MPPANGAGDQFDALIIVRPKPVLEDSLKPSRLRRVSGRNGGQFTEGLLSHRSHRRPWVSVPHFGPIQTRDNTGDRGPPRIEATPNKFRNLLKLLFCVDASPMLSL